MHHNQLIIDAVKRLYLRGFNQRQIELEMRSGGCLTFSRRVLHSQKTRSGRTRPGWIERFGWRDPLSEPPTGAPAAASASGVAMLAGGLTRQESSTAETQRRREKKK